MRSYRASSKHGRRSTPLVNSLRTAVAIGFTASMIVGCSGNCAPMGSSAGNVGAAAGESDRRLAPSATIRELMSGVVDPAADGLWEAVGVISSKTAIIHREPHTGEEWASVRRRATTLMEATNLLMIGPRRAASEGTIAGEGELTPGEIDERIGTNHASFDQLTMNLRHVARKAIDAIDRRDPQELFAVGGELDVACEACHRTFWYPDQATRKAAK